MSPETVLITGASSGIGRELAKLFAADGSRLFLVARREDRLVALAEELKSQHGAQSQVFPQDLGQPQASGRVVEAVGDLAIDVLVNCAGYGTLGRFHKMPLERELDMIQLNVVALTELSRRFLPGMIERKRGGILNVASTAGFQPGPNAAVYYAAKAYVLSLSQALVNEVARTGVTVTCLAPGPTRTEFAERAGMQDTPAFRYNSMDAATVARFGYRAFRKRRPLAVPGFINRALIHSQRLVPRWLVRRFITDWIHPFTDDP